MQSAPQPGGSGASTATRVTAMPHSTRSIPPTSNISKSPGPKPCPLASAPRHARMHPDCCGWHSVWVGIRPAHPRVEHTGKLLWSAMASMAGGAVPPRPVSPAASPVGRGPDERIFAPSASISSPSTPRPANSSTTSVPAEPSRSARISDATPILPWLPQPQASSFKIS